MVFPWSIRTPDSVFQVNQYTGELEQYNQVQEFYDGQAFDVSLILLPYSKQAS